MRVIGGSRRGFPLIAPRGRSTRPTLDRVRESLFNILGDVEGLSVLDLYSGSGSFGIEALSRSAARACFVENERSALAALKRNLEKTRFSECASVVIADVLKLDGGLPFEPFDLVFADPPFALLRDGAGWRRLGEVARALDGGGSLARGARFVVEYEAAFASSDVLGPLSIGDRRTFGRAAVAFYESGE